MVTKPWNERKKSIAQLQGEVAAGFAQVPGVRGIALTPPSLPGGSGFPVDMVIMSTAGPEQLLGIANELGGKAYASGKFWFVDTDLKYDQPQTEIVFDRDKVRTLGVDMSQVGADLSRLLGGNFVNRFSVQGRSYKVIPQIKRAERLTAEQLQSVYVTGPGGKLVPLSTFATLNTTTQPRELKRFQQLNAVRIQAVIPPQMPLDEALTFLESNARQILPRGYSIDFAGESRQLRTEGGKFLGVFALSGILIFLVLAAQFESFRDPFVILLGSAPLALAGSLMFMFLGFTSFNIYSQVGLITLMGLVAKNGILIVEFANHLQERGLDKARAVVEAAGTRLRPILMTTAATVFGHVPLILARGPGAAARNSIGISLVTGMIVGTAFTLFVVPAIYTLVAKSHQREEALEETEDLTAVPEGAVGH
jgi:multidrug efflux pump